ncbi:MAG: hypothetical protein EB127_00175 [Alphaproteobacteria bacterium]|nr:hypothetical protein [Alphaproteobacteria bacterium]
MPQIHNPLGKRDYRVNSGWDLVLQKTDGQNDLSVCGDNLMDVFDQIIRLAISTRKGSYRQDPTFGASPQSQKTHMTQQGLASIKSFIQENLRNSYINPANYPIEVKVVPLSRTVIAIQIIMFVSVPGNNQFLTINSIFNESTQELSTVQTFGE